jgi:hypothetical protein
MMRGIGGAAAGAALGIVLALPAQADENLFGYVKGAETLPQGGWEFYQWATVRSDKGKGDYLAVDTLTELEYGVTDSFNAALGIKTLSIDTSGLLIDAYLPGPKNYVLKPAGAEIELKYNFMKPAIDPIGLSTTFAFDYGSLDPHSGQDKLTLSAEFGLQLQKYFLEGQVVAVGNVGLESTYADRTDIANLPPGFEWPTDPEMEIEFTTGGGVTYRFAPNWYLGAELQYQTEFETEVGQERWSLFMGPTLHYAAHGWWTTLTWFPQIVGGGETYPGQPSGLHLIEKTRNEFRAKLGINF